MRLTDEQREVIEHTGDAVVTAVAGSGKTATLTEYCRRRPDSRILYIAYNRSIKEEAVRKFKKAGIRNVRVETAHSLAYHDYEVKSRFTLHEQGNYKLVDTVDMFSLSDKCSPDGAMAIARHILHFLNYYCNSNHRQITEVDYLSLIKDPDSHRFVNKHLGKIHDCVLTMMKGFFQGTLPLTHDAYLKFFQLDNPVLDYDYILVDEAQDLSPVMLDILLRQNANRVIVGDEAQQIYRYRHAVNSLGLVDFPRFTLSTSFRFPQWIADIAMQSLSLKGMVGIKYDDIHITGLGQSNAVDSCGVVARTNLALLDKALSDMEDGGIDKMAFEGGLNNYTYLNNEGANIFDVLWLYCSKPEKVRDKFVGSFAGFGDLVKFQKETADTDLGLMINICIMHGPELFKKIAELKKLQVPRTEAEIVYSTVHRAKGQEWDVVHLTDDFITADKIQDKIDRDEELDTDQLNEDINILYVAVTRAKNDLVIPFKIDEVSAVGSGEMSELIF